MRFRDRTDAGRRLADALAPLVTLPPVVAGVPRGGVAVALPVVERFRLPLTVVYARKLTAPVAPELAFGAVDEDGEVILEPRITATLGLQRDDVDRANTQILISDPAHCRGHSADERWWQKVTNRLRVGG